MKKTNKLLAILLVVAMACMLCVSAFATDTISSDEVATKAPANGKLVKYLVVPEGTSVPTVVNTFQFAKNPDESSGVTESEIPAIADQEIIINADSTNSNYLNDGNSKVKAIDLVKPTGMTHPGVYAYTVTEKSSVITDGTDKETITPQNEEYVVRYTVKNKADGSGVEVTNITVEDKDGHKVTPTVEDPTVGQNTPDDDTDDVDSGLSFENIYKKDTGDKPVNPDEPTPEEVEKFALRVTKAVTGNPTTAESFPFTMKITAAVGQDAASQYSYIKYNEDNEKVSGPTSITAGQDFTFELSDGQYIAFDVLPSGTRYEVYETMNNAQKYSAYAPEVAVTTKDTSAYAGPGSAELGQSLAAQGDGKTILLVEKSATDSNDKVAYTNAYNKDIDTPTGILMNNLPYIILLILAGGGLTAYIISRRREQE